MEFKVSCIQADKPYIFYFTKPCNLTLSIMEELHEEIKNQLKFEVIKAQEENKILVVRALYTEMELQEDEDGFYHEVPAYWTLKVMGKEKITFEEMPF